jgi:hypothetical protein
LQRVLKKLDAGVRYRASSTLCSVHQLTTPHALATQLLHRPTGEIYSAHEAKVPQGKHVQGWFGLEFNTAAPAAAAHDTH